MAKYGCPECGATGQFTEVYDLTFESTGNLNELGEMEETAPADCVSSETDRFICLTCDEEFDRPVLIET